MFLDSEIDRSGKFLTNKTKFLEIIGLKMFKNLIELSVVFLNFTEANFHGFRKGISYP